MIFVGDIASPDHRSSECLSKVFADNNSIFSGKRLICNFEGLVIDGLKLKSNKPVLYNHSSILGTLDQVPKPVLCLANNHTLDLPGQFESTVHLINGKKFLYTGAGLSLKEAEEPVMFNEREGTVALFNACWDFLLYKHRNPGLGIYVAEIHEERLLERIGKFKKAFPEIAVVVYLHWSLDLEILPFPMYRKFSMDLIDAGTSAVIGSHPHCIQGGERYNKGYIIYSLGNFYLPNNAYANSNLTFPDFARIQLAFEWDIQTNDAVCHWFEYHDTDLSNTLIHLESTPFNESERIKDYSKFQGMAFNEYIAYFKKNRRKSLLIPVYTDYHKIQRNRLFTFLLKIRARFAHALARLHFIKWQN
jgi:hypothetical protein